MARKTAATDPLDSPLWDMLRSRLFGKAPVRFDPALRLVMPMLAENQHQFPLLADARALGAVQRLMIFADLNPITVAVVLTPYALAPWLGIRIKLDQRTPVRAAALSGDGVWHIAGAWADAAGGGCSAPPASRARGDWSTHLGELRGLACARAMPSDGAHDRLRFTVRHPMDTGLVENIPAYNIDKVLVTRAGMPLAQLAVYGATAEDPAFTLLVLPDTARPNPAPVDLVLTDTGGGIYKGRIPAPIIANVRKAAA